MVRIQGKGNPRDVCPNQVSSFPDASSNIPPNAKDDQTYYPDKA